MIPRAGQHSDPFLPAPEALFGRARGALCGRLPASAAVRDDACHVFCTTMVGNFELMSRERSAIWI
ncbi:MAG TPA: hypothetical protein VN289_16855, partial [Paraburkholderia sp.]|nr:hypothetical protein [Paraburkholderia sp.]